MSLISFPSYVSVQGGPLFDKLKKYFKKLDANSAAPFLAKVVDDSQISSIQSQVLDRLEQVLNKVGNPYNIAKQGDPDKAQKIWDKFTDVAGRRDIYAPRIEKGTPEYKKKLTTIAQWLKSKNVTPNDIRAALFQYNYPSKHHYGDDAKEEELGVQSFIFESKKASSVEKYLNALEQAFTAYLRDCKSGTIKPHYQFKHPIAAVAMILNLKFFPSFLKAEKRKYLATSSPDNVKTDLRAGRATLQFMYDDLSDDSEDANLVVQQMSDTGTLVKDVLLAASKDDSWTYGKSAKYLKKVIKLAKKKGL